MKEFWVMAERLICSRAAQLEAEAFINIGVRDQDALLCKKQAEALLNMHTELTNLYHKLQEGDDA